MSVHDLREWHRRALRADGKSTLDGTPIEVRLFGNTLTTASGCWEFQGSRHGRTGHARIHHNGRTHKGARLAYALAHEYDEFDVPADLVVMHTCDNPPCVNPTHLRLGTQLDNIADRDAKGRQRNQHTGKLGPPEGLADALHLGGNGLVPQCAAHAWGQLLDRGGWLT